MVGATVVGATVVGATVVGATVVGATVVGATVVGATVVGATVVGATVVGATVVGLTVVGATVVGLTVAGVVGVVPDAEVDGSTTGPTVVPVAVVGELTRALMIGESPVTLPDRLVEPLIAFGLPPELPLALACAAAGDSYGSARGRASAARDEPVRRTAGLGRAGPVPADECDGAQYTGADHKVPHRVRPLQVVLFRLLPVQRLPPAFHGCLLLFRGVRFP